MARKPLPVTNTPGIEATRCSIAATRSRCPTSYCGFWRVQRNRRLKRGWPVDVEHAFQLLFCRVDQLLIGPISARRVAAAAEKGSHERAIRRRAPWPLRGDPRGGQKRAALDTRYHESGAAHRMADLVATVAECHGRASMRTRARRTAPRRSCRARAAGPRPRTRARRVRPRAPRTVLLVNRCQKCRRAGAASRARTGRLFPVGEPQRARRRAQLFRPATIRRRSRGTGCIRSARSERITLPVSCSA